MKKLILIFSGLMAGIISFILALRGLVPSFIASAACVVYVLYIIRMND